jgi:hypothetical protein
MATWTCRISAYSDTYFRLLSKLLLCGHKFFADQPKKRLVFMRKRGSVVYALIVCIIFFGNGANVQADRLWAITAYGARLTDGDLDDTATFRADFEDSYFFAVALSRRFYTFRDLLDFELEGQVVKHFEDQDHWEFNGLIVSRWLPLPWDKYIDTNLALGTGLSYATETPEIEAKNHSDTSKFLAYLLFEAAFALPDIPQWSAVVRLHHRSGAFGTFNGVRGASNAWGVGVRYSF